MTDVASSIAALPDKTPSCARRRRAAAHAWVERWSSAASSTTLVGSVEEAVQAVKLARPAFAVLDMRLEDGNGLQVVEAIHAERPDARVVMLTGYGNIATAVAAVKAGAVDYLPKPADADDVARALLAARDGAAPPRRKTRCRPTACAGSTSSASTSSATTTSRETARRLNMHRRTLQRILAKRAPRCWGLEGGDPDRRRSPSRAAPPAGRSCRISALRRAGPGARAAPSRATAPSKPSATISPGSSGEDHRVRKAGRHGEIEPVAEGRVLAPLLVARHSPRGRTSPRR